VSFATLALVCAAGLLGPILAAPQRLRVPVLIGELAMGVVLGDTGFRGLHPTDRTFTFLADVGFALVMFVAGSHVPMRDERLRQSLRRGVGRALLVGAVAVPIAYVLAKMFDTGHAPIYAVLFASSSAALILPLVDSLGQTGPDILDVLAQVAVADTACIVALPLAIEPTRAGTAALGAVAVVAAASVAFLVLRWAENSGKRKRLHDFSEQRKFALELRMSLLVLFALAALAQTTQVSIMLGGFSLGLAVTTVGEPRRLAHQLFALTDGFFGPLFFVWIGATLNLRALGSEPKFILLGVALGAAAVLAHTAMWLTKQQPSFGVVASAQLGVPIAAVTVGTQRHLLVAGESAAIILGALITVVAATLASRQLSRWQPAPEPVLSSKA
jgi:Kef-type K+ transport system membrane component KefB